ncbi:methyltransferase domain-containing protein [Streptomyces sp. NPDC051940]|uniref:class I SAM-dependent methyltransferase n=1 Tax=Streptomyces sp. NPDC051940 TaxID=3155675 RepID=UPI003436DD75
MNTTGAAAAAGGTDDGGVRHARDETAGDGEVREAPDEAAARYGDRYFNASTTTTERTRLEALAATFDPATHAVLTSLGVTKGWRCLDVGAGLGTVATWLADRVGEDGEVVALDRNTHYLTALNHPRVRTLEADITSPECAPGTYDLVHARFVLMHLRDRDTILPRLATWLRPGGVLVLSDGVDTGTQHTNEAWRETMAKHWTAVTSEIGTNPHYARGYPALLTDSGLESPGLKVTTPVITATSPYATFWRLTLTHLHPAIATHTDLTDTTFKEALTYLTRPTTHDLAMSMFTSWATHP